MIILPDSGGMAMTNCFVIADENAKEAVLFDAPDHTVSSLLDEVARRGWKLIGLWLTHGHFDHLADHQVVTDRFPDAKVLIHRLDEPLLTNPGPMSRLFMLPFTIPPGKADAHVEEGQALRIGALETRVLHTPGHSPGHVAFHFPTEKVLVGGDLIIGGSVGRTDLPGADPAAFVRSLKRVMNLPDDTQLLPGHGSTSTIGRERQTNEYLGELLGE
jgi:glyoxylase-like metal-dependent hydrolase (beta-lactamase superfamily II)